MERKEKEEEEKEKEKEGKYYSSGRELKDLKVTDVKNPWDKNKKSEVKARALIEKIHNATNRNEGFTLEELALSVKWKAVESYKVYHVINYTRYQINWILTSDYRLTGDEDNPVEWVYFRAKDPEDQRRYIRRRMVDHDSRAYSIAYLCGISSLTETEVQDLMSEAEKIAEEKIKAKVVEQ